ncbi:hypothetical protein WS98_12480 [Burkholderia territorii]|nr:hypothetical protein WS94_21160 [Burkholderia territorii]KVL27544.1 hypothetical protein WS97_28535 [Burkholderia territorii]KVL37994.1 hypothetical protein WS98_12480 [Burkholderia territorii]KVL45542.1 hypothetical protein WT00_29095 [Burkholderia territorii]KVQ61863.1 hypothetical protein WT22_14635 [Burkholderia territorii]
MSAAPPHTASAEIVSIWRVVTPTIAYTIEARSDRTWLPYAIDSYRRHRSWTMCPLTPQPATDDVEAAILTWADTLGEEYKLYCIWRAD